MRLSAKIVLAILSLGLPSVLLAEVEPSGKFPKELIDDVPDYPSILRRQWSSALPPTMAERNEEPDHFGLLLDGSDAQALSLQECIALALRNNTSLRISRLNPVGASAGVRGAWSIFEPGLFGDFAKSRVNVPSGTVTGLTGNTVETFTDEFDFNAGLRKLSVTGGAFSVGWTNNRYKTNPSPFNQLIPRYTTGLGLSVNQPLLRGFGWRHALLLVDAAKVLEKQSVYAFEAELMQIVSRVESSYWLLVAAKQAVRVQEQSGALAKELVRQNEGKFNVGALPQTAVLEARAELARRDANLIRAGNQLSVARDNLRAVVNAKSATGELIAIEPLDEPAIPSVEVDLTQSLTNARARRPELLAARLSIEEKKIRQKVAENQLLPTVNLVGGIGVNGLGGRDAMFPTGDLGAIANPNTVGGYDRSLELLTDGRYYNYSIGAAIEIPLDRARAKADVGLARVDSQRASLTLQQVEEAVTLEVRQAVTTVLTDTNSIEATRISRELAEENVRNQQARYDVGLATTKDLLDYQDRLTQAQAAEIEALTRYHIDLTLLRRFDGTLLEYRNIVLDSYDGADRPWWSRF